MDETTDDGPLQAAHPKERPIDSPCAACSARKMGICFALTVPELERFSAVGKHTQIEVGESVVDEGQPEQHVFSVVKGCLKIYKLLPDGRRQITSFLFPGDFLGLQRSENYVFSAEAVSETTICRMDRKDLDILSSEIPNLEQRLFEFASRALTDVHEQLLLLGRKTAQERLASFLIMLSKKAEERGLPENPIAVPMSRDDIGDYLGLTTETVSRSFSRLRKANLISQDKDKKVSLLDITRLRELSEGF